MPLALNLKRYLVMCIYNATLKWWTFRRHNNTDMYVLGIFFSYQAPQIQRRLVCPPYQWLDNGTKKGSSQLVVCVCTVPQKSVYDHQNHNKCSLKYNRLASWSICDIWNGEWFWHDTSKEGAYHLRCGYLLAFFIHFSRASSYLPIGE